MSNFITNVLNGDAFIDDIDDYIDNWHDSSTIQELSEFLGMTDTEYAYWVENPSLLKQILFCRKNRMSIDDFLKWNIGDILAARSDSQEESKNIINWLIRTGRLDNYE
jgi:hypothetical protein